MACSCVLSRTATPSSVRIAPRGPGGRLLRLRGQEHHRAMTIADRILEAIRYAPLDDDVLAKRLGVSQRQTINQTARRLESQGRLRRYSGPDGKIVNARVDHAAPPEPDPPVFKVRSLKVPEDLV